MKQNDLKDRLFKFSIDVLKMLSGFKYGKETDVVKYQLSRSCTSGGANYEEAQAAVSKSDFINKVSISLKEIREANYWLRIILSLYPETANIKELIHESEELGKILATIIINTRSKL